MKRSARERKRVLVVEDDRSISLGLRINLEGEGYDVFTAEDGDVGLELAREKDPDLIVLDVMLPKRNGFEVLDTLRKEGRRMPVIVLSARSGEMDKVTGLELGAEDYVAKPFSLAELLARVRAALRRGPWVERPADEEPSETIAFADVRIDVGARLVFRADVQLELTATEFDVLMCLVRARGRVLSRESIFQAVWGPNHYGTPRTIDNFLQQLRAKLEIDPHEPKHFHTVRGVGYRFDP